MLKRIPFAEWLPSENHGYTDGGQRIPLAIKSIVTHSADSSSMADPPARLLHPSNNPGSVHAWLRGDGKLYQMVELDEPAWGNGVDYTDASNFNPNGFTSPNAIIRNWFNLRRNPNLDTFSIEFAVYGQSRGALFSKPSPAQMATWARLCAWFRSEGIITPTRDNVILHSSLVRTACPDGRFTVEELVAAIADVEVNVPDNDLRRAVFAGVGSGHQNDADGGLAYANYRLGLRLDPKAKETATGVESWVINLATAMKDLAAAVRDSGSTDAKFAEIKARLDAAAKALQGGTQ